MPSKTDFSSLQAILIPAGAITGMGVGFLINNVAAGMFMGLGAGFALLAIAMIFLPGKS